MRSGRYSLADRLYGAFLVLLPSHLRREFADRIIEDRVIGD
jgi:hypothetical protein